MIVTGTLVLTASVAVLGFVYLNKPSEGNHNWRSTHRSDGRRKQPFTTPQRANWQSIKQYVMHGEKCYPYREGNLYYTGHRRKSA